MRGAISVEVIIASSELMTFSPYEQALLPKIFLKLLDTETMIESSTF